MEFFMDLHVYTNNTPGAANKISFLCEQAAEKGLSAVAFTDIFNVDENGDMPYMMHRRIRHSFFDMAKARQMYFGTVSVFAGIELRQAIASPELVRHTLAAQNYDIVLSSLSRWSENEPFGLKPDMPQAAFNAFAERYADALARTVAETDFDVLSRPVAPLRDTRADFSCFEQLMRPVLQALAQKEKALEVNARDVLGSERIRDLYFRLISYFKEAGGKYLTFGSESYSFDELGAGIELSMSAVKRVGFSSLTFYDQRLPYCVAL